jgi:DNA transformation protein
MAAGAFDPDDLIDLFAPFAPVTMRRMFSGHAVYRNGIVFALALGGAIYLRVDAESIPAFEAQGMPAFSYATKGGERAIGSYRRMPDICFDDEEALVHWARLAWQATLRTPSKTSRRRNTPA